MRCRIKNIEVNYEIYGHGKPVIMLHGYHADHVLMTKCFEPIFEKKDGYKRIYVDLPGMGKTKAEEWIKNSDIMLDIVIKFIDIMIPNEKFLLVGESYGGYLSRGIIYKMMNMVEGLVLLCPCIVADTESRNKPLHTVIKKDEELFKQLDYMLQLQNHIKQEEISLGIKIFEDLAVVQTPYTWDRYVNELLPGMKNANLKFLDNLKKYGYEFSFDVDKLKTKFEKPTLMLLGRQDARVGYKDAWNILDNYTRASFCVLDRAGHNLQIEQKDLFESLVNEWLLRVNEAVC